MRNHNLGYPRIGSRRETKKANEQYWKNEIDVWQLLQQGKSLRKENWFLQKTEGIQLIPSNDFSLYDHVLDVSLMVGNIPERFRPVFSLSDHPETDVYFAMARGFQQKEADIPAMEMTKWFDTNYHYIVPEFVKDQSFHLFSHKVIDEFVEAKKLGITTKPVLLGPVSYLLLGKQKEEGFHRLDLLNKLLPVYSLILSTLHNLGAKWVQLDEPCLVTDLDQNARLAYALAYKVLHESTPSLSMMLTTYFGALGDNLNLATSLPVQALHIDLAHDPEQIDEVLAAIPTSMQLSLGVVDGRNIWKNDIPASLSLIEKAIKQLGEDRLWIAPSCSLIHVPCDLDLETKEASLPKEVKNRMAFAKQKLKEINHLSLLASNSIPYKHKEGLTEHNSISDLSTSHNTAIKDKIAQLTPKDIERESSFTIRKKLQQEILQLPPFPTTTIGSFPQTSEIRITRARYKKGLLNEEDYERAIHSFIKECIEFQENIKLDVLVHGEAERTDMVEYFGEQLKGFAFTENGWVQSYGSRCVKPPVIYGDVSRPAPMTVKWIQYAQSLTNKPVKGMLTGPVTILQWSFVRNDQPRSETALQIALALREEVLDLEKAGIRIIQMDEPALREGLPLRQADRAAYLDWAVKAFKLSVAGVKDETQIHTHMCYAEFNDIIYAIASMDADVITIETSRSQMELLDAFVDFHYPNDIGPGVYDIHSARVPSVKEMVNLLQKASAVIARENLWVNPDCGLKTRAWEETKSALQNMVQAAEIMRS